MALVVARYNEDIEWVKGFPTKYLYNKGDINTISDGLREHVTNLPNLGRESHTYLYHIIKHYDALDDITIFTQGKYDDHCQMSLDTFRKTFSKIDAYSKNYIDSKCWGGYRRHYNFNIKYWTAELKNKDKEYGPWFESVFNQQYNNSTRVYKGGIFSVSKSTILKRPKSFYEKLLKEVEYDNNPIEGHFMERSWLEVFCIDGNI